MSYLESNAESSVESKLIESGLIDFSDSTQKISETKGNRWVRWLDRMLAFIILINVCLTFFDTSYYAIDGFYERYFPGMARFYSQIGRSSFLAIDRYFVAFFALEYLIRTFWKSRVNPTLTWLDAMLRRWYDLLLLLPTWRWLRVVPALVRSHQSKLINLERIMSQITHEPAAYLANRVSMFLLVRLVNQMHESVESGEAARLLLEPQHYVQVGNTNKVDAIIDRLLQLSIYRVLPRIQPEVEALLRHNLSGAFKQSDFYQGLQAIPGIKAFPSDIVEQLSEQLAQMTYDVLAAYYADEKGRRLLDQLAQEFKSALRQELQDEATQRELQSLLSGLLEELKMNYIQRSVERDPEETLQEADQLHQKLAVEDEALVDLNSDLDSNSNLGTDADFPTVESASISSASTLDMESENTEASSLDR